MHFRTIFLWNCFENTIFLNKISTHFQIIFINSLLVVDEDDNGNFRLENVKIPGSLVPGVIIV